MKIKKETIVWIFLIVPFFYPSSIADTSLSSIWYYWKLCAVACGVIYIFKRIKKIKCLEKSTWFIIVMYIMQIIASAINKLDILYDFKTAVMMGVFVLVVSFLLYEYGNRAILFFYRLVNVFIWLNFLSVIFLYGRGIARDSYDTAIYFWSTKNHIISLGNVVFPAMSAAEDKERLKAIGRRAMKTTSYIIFPIMIGLIVVSRPLILLLLTDKWSNSIIYMQILCLYWMTQPIQTTNWQIIKAIGRSDLCLKLEILKKAIGITKAIRDQVPAGSIRKLQSLTKIQKEWLRKRLRKADFGEKMRLHYYLGVILEDENEVQECFRIIQSEVLEATIKSLAYNEQARIVTDYHTVRLPLRVNWGGGWSDTPPYCNEKGGTVLNAAILLNGEKPVEVTLERIPEQKVVFDSRDMDVHGEFDTIEPLQATGDPYDPFALQKACLLACGIIPREGHTLGEILERLGSGFVMHSEVTNVPKGSGLGTSSILSAACVKAVFEFMGIAYTEEDLYAHVLAMEQIMSTGGGWQDQVGGITSGLKYITSMPGLQQQLQVAHIELSPQTKKELDERFVLIYTGQRRLARNLLRDVVGRYVGNEPDSLFALEEIQKTAALMRFELERGNVDGFAKLLDYHWELSKKIDAGSSNTLIEQIFSSIEELVDGKLVCGAGGGGFLQVILKKGVTRQMVEERLKEVFMDSLVGVADCNLVWE